MSDKRGGPRFRFFTPDEVRAIRAWCVPGQSGTHNAFDRLHGVKATARKFGCSAPAIRAIVARRVHADVLDLEAAA